MQLRQRWLLFFFLICPLHLSAVAQTPPQQPPSRPAIPPIEGLEDLSGLGQQATPKLAMSSRFYTASDGTGVLEVTCKLSPGAHVYSLTQPAGGPVRSTLSLVPSEAYALTGQFQPTRPPKVTPPDLFPVNVEEHTGTVTWRAPFRLAAGVDPATLRIEGRLDGQVCTDAGICIPLSQYDTRFVSTFAGPGAQPPPIATPAANPAQSPSSRSSAATGAMSAPAMPTAQKLMRYLIMGFFGGLILNVMPCVLPVIGLKVMSFAQQAGESPARVLWLNVCFVAGLIFVFMVLAALAAFAGWGWGAQFQRPEFGIALALIVFVFALSFLGVWEIPIPGFVGSGTAAAAAQQEGPAGAFAKGLLTTLLATPCSGPLIVPTLAWAVTQPKPVIFATFFSMGLGMGAPYLLAGLSPGLLKLLPKPGPWMETFKQVMGFVLLATVVWIFSFLDQDHFLPTLALLFAAWAACWWMGRIPLTAPAGDRWRGYVTAAVFTGVAGFLAFSYLTPQEELGQPFSLAKLNELQQRGRTVFIDFTADW